MYPLIFTRTKLVVETVKQGDKCVQVHQLRNQSYVNDIVPIILFVVNKLHTLPTVTLNSQQRLISETCHIDNGALYHKSLSVKRQEGKSQSDSGKKMELLNFSDKLIPTLTTLLQFFKPPLDNNRSIDLYISWRKKCYFFRACCVLCFLEIIFF